MGIIGEVKISPNFADLHPLEIPLGVSFREVPWMCFKRQYLSQNHTEGEIFCAMWVYFQLNPIPNFMSGS